MSSQPDFLSPEPEVRLTQAFTRPFDNAVATARTCYSSSGIITEEQVAGDALPDPEARAEKARRRDRLARDLYQAGHHTTFQHAHFQFSLKNVSRQFLWTFLHSHPFYNSEQVSQRYVEVRPGHFTVPPLEGKALGIYLGTVESQHAAYRELNRMLFPLVEAEYFRRFKGRRKQAEKYRRAIEKKSLEVARYVLPVATFAYLYHTVNGITLLRYYRLCEQCDAPMEQKIVSRKMVDELLRVDPNYQVVLEEPIPFEETLERKAFDYLGMDKDLAPSAEFLREFDDQLDGNVSRLVGPTDQNEPLLAQAVREVLGVGKNRLDDKEAIELALDPARNPYLGEDLNLDTVSKLTRALHHAHYTFRKKISHTADSQNQRHRMTPASRPVLAAHFTDQPDYVFPALAREDEPVRRKYQEAMEIAWKGMAELDRLGVPKEFSLYLLPNAAAIRFTESTDLLNLRHKLTMRLCYLAQEEIWQASLDEARQIREANPTIGRYLLPPCGVRLLAKSAPICPEGNRYCGERVWTYDLKDYDRLI
ncbi:MAG: FAD-dependent thymidylate synthase [Acidobacteriota bacterium]